jgi:hypothetical protein
VQVDLTDERSLLEGKLHEHEAEVVRSRASLTRISQVSPCLVHFLNEVSHTVSIKYLGHDESE